jgi:putative membrane-bound dehydrogenase-like protein
MLVNRFLGAVAFLIAMCFSSFLAAQSRDDPKIDLNFQQSPTKPAPEGIKIVAQGGADERLKGMLLPEGVKIDLVALEPTVLNPRCITFDDVGHLYVLEWVAPPAKDSDLNDQFMTVQYKDGSLRKVAVKRKAGKDRVKLLTRNAQGIYEKAKVILEDELPAGMLVHDGWIYLAGQGSVRRYKLDEALKEADKEKPQWPAPQIIAQGFSALHPHQVSGLTIGNDGWLYITAGDEDNVVEGSDGSRATVLRSGAVFRCRPDGSKLHTHSLGYRNPLGNVVFDATGNMFHVDNGLSDGSKWTGNRLMHVPEGIDFGWRRGPGTKITPDHVRAAVWGEAPGKMAPMLKTGQGAAAGLFIYNDSSFPEEYRSLLYYPDPVRQLVRAYRVQPRGADFEVTHEFEFMKSKDPLFRPCQMAVGPDGAMYVADLRVTAGDVGKPWGDGKQGRIYRLSWAGTNQENKIEPRAHESWAKIKQAKDEELLATLESLNCSDRQKAHQELVRRGDKHRPALMKLLADGNNAQPARVAALGALHSLWNGELRGLFCDLVDDTDPVIRRLAAQGLALNTIPGAISVQEALLHNLGDRDLAARRAVYLALGRIGGSADALANALRFNEGKDEVLRDGLVRALEATGKTGVAALLAMADSGEGKELERVLEVYPTLRSRPAAEGLPTLLKNYHLSGAQKAALIRSYNNYQLDPPLSLKPLAEYLLNLPPLKREFAKGKKEVQFQTDLVPVRLGAIDILASHGTWTEEKAKEALLSMLQDSNLEIRLAAINGMRETRLIWAIPIVTEMLDRSKSPEEEVELKRTLDVLKKQK